MRDIILIPTYNECENIEPLLREIFSIYPQLSILVIDDNSPDGTAAVVERLKLEYPNLNLLKRLQKTGLGDAYKAAMLSVLYDDSIRSIITMDADGSHPISALKDFLSHTDNYELIVGSRYVKGGGVSNWDQYRRCLSAGGNFYNRLITGLPVHDLTAGFICIRRTALAKIDLNSITASGFSFLLELKFKLIKEANANSFEVPIIFVERKTGQSKLSGSIVREGLLTPWKLNRNYFMNYTLIKSTKPKKVLICTGIYPPDIGGPATIIGELGKELEKNKYSVKVITYSESTVSSDGIVRISKNGRLSRLNYLFNLFRLSFWADVMYVTDTYSVGYFAYLIKKIFRKPYILRFAGDSAWETAFGNGWVTDYIVDFQKRTYERKIEIIKARRTKILCSADKVIAVSEFMKSIAQIIGVKDNNIRVIYNSVDFENIKLFNRQDFFRKYKLTEDDKLLVTACRLTPWKGVEALIKVIKELREKFPIKLLILGDGSELQKLQTLVIDLKMDDQVIFAGVINQEDMTGYLTMADIFILNTYYEGLSHTLLEAIKAQVPIVASNAGGNPEVIQSGVNGILVDYNNEVKIREAIEYILNNPEQAQLFVEAANCLANKFSWINVVNETIQVINEI